MKTYELLPTCKNLFETYSCDTISRNADVHHFVELLNSIEGCCSIALDGAWGSGKTFFVKQVKMILDSKNEFVVSDNDEYRESVKLSWENSHKEIDKELMPQVCVYYDAWENDNDKDPVLSLVYSILQSVDADYSLKKEASCIKIAASILDFFSGKDWSKLIEGFKGEDPLKELRTQKDIQKRITEFLDSLLPEKGDRLVIFIDELDRCNPAFAVKLLERLKHYFSNDRITFVFSINTYELQHTIKRFYGEDFDACRYLDRFFDLRVSLPPADLQKYYQSLNFSNGHYTYDIVCDAVIKQYHFELREISKYIKLAKIAAYEPTHDEGRKWDFSFPDGQGRHFGLLYVIPIMIGLKIANSNKYYDFIQGKDYTPMKEIADCLKLRFFNLLLSKNESYDIDDASKTTVTIDSKLKAAYEAMFVTEYTGSQYNTVIGECEFERQTKEFLIKTASLLSNFSNYDY